MSFMERQESMLLWIRRWAAFRLNCSDASKCVLGALNELAGLQRFPGLDGFFHQLRVLDGDRRLIRHHLQDIDLPR